MRVTFASIVLNEQQYLAQCIHQHLDLCDGWVIVEGADKRFPRNRVTEDGLSIDSTSEIITDIARRSTKLEYIRHGWAEDKAELRNRYAELADDGVLVVFDADEFLTHEHLAWLIDRVRRMPGPGSVRIPHVHFWKDSTHVITGGYYDVPHDRAYFWLDGCRYRDNHNHPCLLDGRALWECHHATYDRVLLERDGRYTHSGPAWLHYGFVKDPASIGAKNAYYMNRGERTTRPGTTRDRAAWFSAGVPEGCRLLDWQGPWPEVMQ